jgi:catechol 2,3-dioxygenase-like lactoylglutathione lyase family enzyme
MSREAQTDTTPVRPVVGMYSFFSPDPNRLARFWADLMQLPVAEGTTDDLVMLDFNHQVSPQTWIFQRQDVGSKAVAAISLDIGSQDEGTWTQVATRAEELGAERVADREETGVRWIEMKDPDGNRFRVFAPRSSA